MATGKVKWFNNAKGYGFVRPDNGGEDLFVHYSYICMDGYKSLKAGQVISYEPHQAPKGLHAMNICIVEDTEPTPTSSSLESPVNTTSSGMSAFDSMLSVH